MQRDKDLKFKNDHNALTLGLKPGHLEINNKGNVQVIVQMLEQFGTNSLIHGVFERENLASRRLMKKLGFSFKCNEIVNAVDLEVHQLSYHYYKSKKAILK